MREYSNWKSWSIFAALITILSLWSQHYIFPNYSVDFSKSSKQIIDQAKHFAQSYESDIENYQHAIRLNTHSSKHYLEKTMGSEKVAQWIQSQNHLYYWTVRFFKPNQQRELRIQLSPQGNVIGFLDQWPQSQSSPSISQEEALKLIQKQMAALGYEPSQYTQVDASSSQKENHQDHSFRFKSNRFYFNFKDGGYFDLSATVSGNQVTQLAPGTFVPQTFKAKINQLNDIKQTIIHYSSFALYLLMITGIFSLLWMWRNGALATSFSLIVGGVMSGLFFLTALNQWPHIWMDYITTQSEQTFVSSWLFSIFIFSIMQGIQVGLLTMTGEALYRKTAPKMAPLSLDFSFRNRSEHGFFSVLNGYLLVAFLLGYVSLYYFITTHLFDFWLPTDIMVDHNILATYFPWLSPLTSALHAGLSEELIFRAIPIGGTLLLIQKKKVSSSVLPVVLCLQALLWACLHVTYPTNPYYARIIELSLVGLALGLIYQRCGLFTVILGHSLYDFVLMVQPIVSASMLQSSSIVVMIIGLAPLLKVLYTRYQQTEPDTMITQDKWIPDASPPSIRHSATLPKSSRKTAWLLSCFMILGVFLLWVSPPASPPHLTKITRDQAQKISQNYYEKIGISFNKEWTELMQFNTDYGIATTDSGTPISHKILMQKIPSEHLPQWSPYFQKPGWIIAHKRFNTGTPMDQMETFSLYLSPAGEIIQHIHTIPQDRVTQNLDRQQALELAEQSRPKGDWKLIEEQEQNIQKQTHWFFKFEDQSLQSFSGIQPFRSIHIIGDKIASNGTSIHLKDAFSKPVNQNIPRLMHYRQMGSISYTILALIWAFMVIRHMVFHHQKSKKTWLFFSAFVIIQITVVLNISSLFPWQMSLNRSIASQFPLLLLFSLLFPVIYALIQAFSISYLSSLNLPWRSQSWKSYTVGVVIAFSGLGIWSSFFSSLPSVFLSNPNAKLPLLGLFFSQFNRTLTASFIGLTVIQQFNQPSRSKHLFIAILLALWALSWQAETDLLHTSLYASLAMGGVLLWALSFAWRLDARTLLGCILGYRIIDVVFALDRSATVFVVSVFATVLTFLLIEKFCVSGCEETEQT